MPSNLALNAKFERTSSNSGIARTLNTLGDLAYCFGENAAGLQILDEALAAGRALGDRRVIAESLRRLGMIQSAMGEIAAAKRSNRESVAICREIGDQWGIAEGDIELASVLLYSGRFDEAATLYQEAADLYQALGGGVATPRPSIWWGGRIPTWATMFVRVTTIGPHRSSGVRKANATASVCLPWVLARTRWRLRTMPEPTTN